MWYLAITNPETGEYIDAEGNRVDLLSGATIRRTVDGKTLKNKAAGAREYENKENAIRYMRLTPWTEKEEEEKDA